MKLTLQQLEAHLWGAANILRGKTAGQDYKNYTVPSLCRETERAKQWFWANGQRLLVDLKATATTTPGTTRNHNPKTE